MGRWWLSIAVLVTLSGPSPYPPPREQGAGTEVTREVYLMGTRCTLTAFASEGSLATRQLEEMIVNLEESERQLSTWRSDSELSRLNALPVGSSLQVTGSLMDLLEKLAYWSAATDRAFDPAIGSLVAAWGLRVGGLHPSEALLREARERAGIRRVSLDPGSGTVSRRREVTIDCGGFGKGEALDRLRSWSRHRGFTPWLVNLGGQVGVYGLPPARSHWAVDLAHPRERSASALPVGLSGGSLATSGGSERDVRRGGGRIGHVLDPRTGLPAKFGGSVTVWHASALVADILSTALYVMGPQQGRVWAEARGIAACYLDLPEGGGTAVRPIFTPAFAPLLHPANVAATGPQTSPRPPPF